MRTARILTLWEGAWSGGRGAWSWGVWPQGGAWSHGGCLVLGGAWYRGLWSLVPWGCTMWPIHHAFDVTCMLPPHQLRPTNSPAAYILLVGHVTYKACWDTIPSPPWTEFLTHASEYITLPQTSFAGSKNTVAITTLCFGPVGYALKECTLTILNSCRKYHGFSYCWIQ